MTPDQQTAFDGRFAFDREAGVLVWLPRDLGQCKNAHQQAAWNAKFAGKIAGYERTDGYRVINLGGKYLFAHRIIWALEYGMWPDQIDHINGNPRDNRLANLRSVTPSENNRNLKRRTNNKSGRTGIRWDAGNRRWAASIQIDGKSVWLGRFASREDASSARAEAEIKFGFHQNHGRTGS